MGDGIIVCGDIRGGLVVCAKNSAEGRGKRREIRFECPVDGSVFVRTKRRVAKIGLCDAIRWMCFSE